MSMEYLTLADWSANPALPLMQRVTLGKGLHQFQPQHPYQVAENNNNPPHRALAKIKDDSAKAKD